MFKITKKCYIFLYGMLILVLLFASSSLAENTYKIDPTHSTLGFAVKHMQVGMTRGEFTDYKGEITFDEDNLDNFKAWIVVKTQSIDTRFLDRDEHLRGANFFDVENYPTIIIIAKKLTKSDNGYNIVCELTMKGVTKEVSGPISIRGPKESPFGGDVIGFSGETIINRQDYNISWNAAMPDGGFVVGDDVKLMIDIEADKK